MTVVILKITALLNQLGLVIGGGASEPHWIHDWINIEAIQLLVHHTSAVIGAVVLFWLAGLVVQYLLHDSLLKKIVLWTDEFVLLCLFVFFAYELLRYLCQRV